MNIRQTAHLALAAVLLIQSVAALAKMIPAEPLSSVSQVSSLENAPMKAEGKTPCHDTSTASVSESGKDCCASMHGQCCKFGCAAPVVVLPASALPLLRKQHPPVIESDSAGRVDNPLCGLFRPPRSIQ